MSDEDVAIKQEDTPDQETELSDEEQAMAKLKEAIRVDKEEIGPLRLKLTVTVPQETLDERRGEQFDELRRDAVIPGFRKGRAPQRLVEKRFATDVGEQLITQMLSSGYLAAVEKEDLKPLGDPLFWAKVKEERVGEDGKSRQVEVERLLSLDKALDHLAMPKDGALTFSCELELKPEFELPELGKIPVEKPRVEIGDEDVDAEVQRLCMLRGTFKPVDNGKIKRNDMIIADMKMTVDGDIIASEENFDLAARDVHIKGVPLTGFGDTADGQTIDATLTFEVTVPDDHENIDIRGKTAKFEFVVREVKRLVVPKLDKAFLESIGFDSEQQLRDTVRTSLSARLDSTLQRGMRAQVAAYLLDKTKLEVPDRLSQRQTERSVSRRMIEMLQLGMPEAEVEKRMDEMRNQAHDQAVHDLKLFFILERIAEDSKIEVGEERLNSAIADIARQSNRRFDRVRDDLSKGDGLTTLYMSLRDEATLDKLLEDAVITEMEGPKEQSAAKKTPAVKVAAKSGAESKAGAAKKPAPKASGAKKATAQKASPKKKTTKKKTGS